MSDPEATQQNRGGTVWDFPNQQVVRPDKSGPGDPPSGTGGSSPGGLTATLHDTDDLDTMTKDELLAYAQKLEVKPANGAMTKDELRAGIDAKIAEGGT